ncbi:lysophosphatidic acid receptor 6-like [Rhinoraja longicauda]
MVWAVDNATERWPGGGAGNVTERWPGGGAGNETAGDSEPLRLPFTLLYSVIIVAGLVLNAGALWVFRRHIRLRSGTTVYMRHLATADLLLVCFLPFRLAYNRSSGEQAQLVCEVATLIFLVNMYTSIFFLACISLDRCVAMLWPLRLPVRRLHRAAPWVSAAVWLLSVGASLPPYLIVRLSGQPGINRTCHDYKAMTHKLTVFFTLSIGFGVPFGLLLVCSLLALRTVRGGQRVGGEAAQLRAARKTQKMILANLLIFTFCFLPYHALLPFYDKLLHRAPRVALNLYQAAQLLASSNAALDPVLYYFSTEAFRKTQLVAAVGAVLCPCRHRHRHRHDPGTPVPTEADNVIFISTVKIP